MKCMYHQGWAPTGREGQNRGALARTKSAKIASGLPPRLPEGKSGGALRIDVTHNCAHRRTSILDAIALALIKMSVPASASASKHRAVVLSSN